MAEYGRHPLGSYKYGPSAQNNAGDTPEAPTSMLLDVSAFTTIIDDELYEAAGSDIVGTSAGTSTATGAASWISTATGTSAGTSTASGVVPTLVLLDVTTVPANYASGLWDRDAMNNGVWEVTITPTNVFSSYSGFKAILGNGNGGLWIVNSQIELYRDEDGTKLAGSGNVTNPAGNPVKIRVDEPAQTMTVSDAGAGNGTLPWLQSGTIFATGNLGVGQYTDGSLTFAGGVSDVTAVSSVSSANGTAAGSATVIGAAIAMAIATGVSGGAATVSGDVVGIVSGSAAGTSSVAGVASWTSAASGSSSGTSTAIGQVPSAMEVGAHAKVVQLYGAGSPPATLTLTSVEAGSRIVVMMGGNNADLEDVPTSSGLTFTQLLDLVEYPDYAGYGVTAWYSSPSAGGSVSISNNVTSFDEISMWAVELKGAPRFRNGAFVNRPNAGATATQAGPTVATAGASIAIGSWWGSGPVGSLPGGSDHVVTATRGTELEKHSFNDLNGYVQFFAYGELTTTAETYQQTFTASPTQGLQGWLLVFDLVTDTGTAAGSSTANGEGRSVVTAAGASAGSSSVAGVGSALAPSTGSAAGTSAASGAGAALAFANGSAAAAATVTGQASALAEASGAAAGTSSANGAAIGAAESAGTSAGSSTASGDAVALGVATGSASGAATAIGASAAAGLAIGTAAGSSSAVGDSSSAASAIGAAAGSASATGTGTAVAEATGAASGSSSTSGAAAATVAAIGTSAGSSTAVGAVGASALGSAAGVASAIGQGFALAAADGVASGGASAFGETTTPAVDGASEGSSTAGGVSQWISMAVGSASGVSTAVGLVGSLPAVEVGASVRPTAVVTPVGASATVEPVGGT